MLISDLSSVLHCRDCTCICIPISVSFCPILYPTIQVKNSLLYSLRACQERYTEIWLLESLPVKAYTCKNEKECVSQHKTKSRTAAT